MDAKVKRLPAGMERWRDPEELRELAAERRYEREEERRLMKTARARVYDWLITPTNESQELNYVESFKGTAEQVQARIEAMCQQLSRALPQATIACKAETTDGRNRLELVTP